jgi:hypothetical protein
VLEALIMARGKWTTRTVAAKKKPARRRGRSSVTWWSKYTGRKGNKVTRRGGIRSAMNSDVGAFNFLNKPWW